MTYDIVVAGGGAAGLCAAICAKRKSKKCRVAVLEALDRVGKKLITTGNGRCNITNREPALSRYHSEDPEFVKRVLSAYSVSDTLSFFSSAGVEIVFSDDGRAYPASLQASSVVDALRFSADEAGVETHCGCRLTDFVHTSGGFTLTTSLGKVFTKSLILAPGLLSGGAKIGSDGSVFELLKKHGYSAVPPTPSLVQLKTETDITRQLKGIRFDCGAALFENGRPVKSEYGEILFTEYGLSGPPIFQLSRAVSRKKAGFEISLDLLPDVSAARLSELLFKRRKDLSKRLTGEFLTGFLNKRVGQVILRKSGADMNTPVSAISSAALSKTAELIKDFRFRVTGTTGFANSQVSAGGISTAEFSPDTLGSKRDAGLFAAGELLDVDGDCGGFNLQWAWSSAMLAADSAVKFLRAQK